MTRKMTTPDATNRSSELALPSDMLKRLKARIVYDILKCQNNEKQQNKESIK